MAGLCRERDDFWLRDQGKAQKGSSFEVSAQMNGDERHFKWRMPFIVSTVFHSLLQKINISAKVLRPNLEIIIANDSFLLFSYRAMQ